MTETQTFQKDRYKEGLWDSRWRKLRERILERDRHRCRSCGNRDVLHVHHRQYHREKGSGEWKRPWEYDPYLLVTLCDTCHREGHRQYSIPIKDI